MDAVAIERFLRYTHLERLYGFDELVVDLVAAFGTGLWISTDARIVEHPVAATD